jgi:hypothetical protein
MRHARVPAALATLLLLAGCAGARIKQDCYPSIGNDREYERCLRNNESSEQAVQDRAKAKRAGKTSPGDFDKGDIQSDRDD